MFHVEGNQSSNSDVTMDDKTIAVKAFDEIIVKNNMDYLEVSDAQLKYVQLTGVDWRDKFNWAWLISCGYLPYSEATRRRALPTIDRGNHHQYVFDSTIYCCADAKK